MTGLHPQTLRGYESKGLIEPARSGGGTRLYSENDILRLEEISGLSEDGVGISGVARILELEEEISSLSRTVNELETCINALSSENTALRHALFGDADTAIIVRPIMNISVASE